MAQDKLRAMTVEELADRFRDLTVRQHEAERKSEYARYNQLFRQMEAVERELKSRPGDQRRALIPLYNHQKAQVRLMAAAATLTIEPEAARRVMQLISDRDEYPQAADARGIMKAIDEGRFVFS